MKIGICDDNIDYLHTLKHMVKTELEHHPNITIEAITPVHLSAQIKNSTFSYDLLLTDIDMGQFNGIDLALAINNAAPQCIIIFISNYLNFATDVYEIEHIYFILKEESNKRLPKALSKAIAIYDERIQQHLLIRYHNIETHLLLSDISHIEAFGRYLYIHDRCDTYKYIMSLKKVSQELNSNFIRCHHSYILNLNFIRSLSRTNCTLSSGEILPISQTYSKQVYKAYMEHISGKLS